MRRLLRLLPALVLISVLPACGSSSPVALNEFVASNISGLTDSSGSTPDWIELFNTSAEAVALDGWFISDDEANPSRHPLDGLSVPGDGFLLLYASGDTTLGEEHLPFRLSAAGEQVVLSGPDGIVDAINYGQQTADVAMARIPDGTGDWEATEPTPGEPNR